MSIDLANPFPPGEFPPFDFPLVDLPIFGGDPDQPGGSIAPIGTDGHVEAVAQGTAVTSALPTGFTFDGTQFCLMVVSYGSGTPAPGTTITTPTGWIPLPQPDGTSTRIAVFWRFLQNGDSSPSFTLSSSRSWCTHSTAFSGVDPNTPINAQSQLDYASASSYSTSDITPTIDNSMIVSVWGGKTGTGLTQTVTIPSGWTDTVGGTTSPTTPFQSAIAAVNNNWATFQYQLQTTATSVDESVTVANSATNENYFLALLPSPAATTVQNITPTGIGNGEQFGAITTTPGSVTATQTGIQSEDQFGAITSTVFITTAGITSEEREGTVQLNQSVSTTGIQTTELFGAATVSSTATISATGISSEQALGEPTATFIISTSGISSQERFGAVTATVVTAINTNSITTYETFGAVALSSTTTISATGISSASVLGATTTTVFITPTGTQSEQVNNSIIATVVVGINPTGITSAERFGSISTSASATILPTGIPTTELFGTTASTLFVAATGIRSEERFGLANTSIPVTITINAIGIRSSEQFGTITAVIVVATGIEIKLTTWILSYNFTTFTELGTSTSTPSYTFITVAEEADIADVPSLKITTGVSV